MFTFKKVNGGCSKMETPAQCVQVVDKISRDIASELLLDGPTLGF